MRQGCISLGEARCDRCGTIVPHSERYLAVNEKDGVEQEEGQIVRYCVACALEKGYAVHKQEKGERILTFFAQSDY